MKKILTLLISLIVLFLFIMNFKADKKEYIYEENFRQIKFDNLNSKNIDELFKDINETVIEIEVQTPYFTKNYRFHTGLTDNIEKNLMLKLTKDLKDLGKQELATTYQIKGVKINRMAVLCTLEELEIIKNRTHVE